MNAADLPAPLADGLACRAKHGFANGYLFVFLTLALCLVVSFGGVGILVVGVVASGALTAFGRSIGREASRPLSSQTKMVVLLVVAAGLVRVALVLYHGDDIGELETQAKLVGAALIVALALRSFPVSAILWGAAVGGAIAGIVALVDTGWVGLPRAQGPTNAIRFGMVAVWLASICIAGLIMGQKSTYFRVAMMAGATGALVAAFLSGSRGAVLVLPVVLLLFAPVLWRRSKRLAVMLLAGFVLCSVLLGLVQNRFLREGASSLTTSITALLADGIVADQSTRYRIEMLRLAGGLFAQSPLTGVGESGWKDAVANQIATSPPGIAFDVPYNQAHNQLANDLAKGGLIRALAGILLVLVPFAVFARRLGLGSHSQALPAQLGSISCVAFAGFGLTEAVLELSLSASLYIIAIVYLVRSSER